MPVLGGTVVGSLVSAGTQVANMGPVVLSNSNGVSFGMNASSVITASVAAGGGGIAAAAGTQTATSGTVVLSNSNGISFGLNGSVVTAAYDGVRSVSAGTASGNFSGLTFSNGGNVTFGLNNGTVTASVAAPGTTGITGLVAGTQTATQGSVSFANSNGVSFGISGSSLLTASVSQGGVANAAGTQTATTGTVVFSNSNNISFGMTNSSVVTASFSYAETQTFVGGVAGSGASTVTNGTVQFSNANGVSFGLNGSTMTASFTPPLVSRYYQQPAGSIVSSAITVSQASIQFVQLPYDITFSRVDIPVQVSVSSTATAATIAIAITSGMVIYSRNGSTLNPIVGSTANTTYSYASNNTNYSSVIGGRFISFGLATSLPAGEYFIYAHISTAGSSVGTATTGASATLSLAFGSMYNSASGFADFGVLTAASTNVIPGLGMLSSRVSNTTQSLQLSQITATGTAMRANIPLLFRNI